MSLVITFLILLLVCAIFGIAYWLYEPLPKPTVTSPPSKLEAVVKAQEAKPEEPKTVHVSKARGRGKPLVYRPRTSVSHASDDTTRILAHMTHEQALLASLGSGQAVVYTSHQEPECSRSSHDDHSPSSDQRDLGSPSSDCGSDSSSDSCSWDD